MGRSHPNLGSLPFDFCPDDARQCPESHLLSAHNAFEVSESGRAASTIAAHFGFAAIGVEEPPPEVHLGIVFDQDEAISPYRKLSAARKAHQVLAPIRSDPMRPVVDDDEIIAAAGHFKEGDRIIKADTLQRLPPNTVQVSFTSPSQKGDNPG